MRKGSIHREVAVHFLKNAPLQRIQDRKNARRRSPNAAWNLKQKIPSSVSNVDFLSRQLSNNCLNELAHFSILSRQQNGSPVKIHALANPVSRPIHPARPAAALIRLRPRLHLLTPAVQRNRQSRQTNVQTLKSRCA